MVLYKYDGVKKYYCPLSGVARVFEVVYEIFNLSNSDIIRDSI